MVDPFHNRNRLARGLRSAAPVWLLLVAAGCSGPFPQSTFRPVSDFADKIDSLFYWIFILAVVVFVVVETLLVFVVIRYRERPGRPDPKHVHGHTALEIGWTLAPALIIILIAVPTIRTIFEVDGDTEAGALEVQVIGHQWWWEFRYPELGIVTANELHVPRGRQVGLALTSFDVIHSFWVPRIGGKRDVIKGRTNRLAFTADSLGTYMGQCAEFCGASHANMRMRLVVDDSAGFDEWVRGQQQTVAPIDTTQDLVARGHAVFTAGTCGACHTIDGVSQGILGPNLTHVGSRMTIAAGLLRNDPAGLTRWLEDPPAVKPGSLMPNLHLSDQDIAALVAYLQSLK